MPMMASIRQVPFAVRILLAMTLGIGLGLIARAIGSAPDEPNTLLVALDTIGGIFVQLLKLLVPPLIFTAIVTSIAGLGELRNAARLATQTLIWFAITALIAVLVGLVVGTIILHGGQGAALVARPHAAVDAGWLDFLKGIVPTNIFGLAVSARADGDAIVTGVSIGTLQIVALSFAIGLAAHTVGAAAAPFISFVAALYAIVRKLLGWVIALTPLGTIGLLGTAVARYGWETLSQLGAFAGAVYLGLAIVLLGIYPLLLVANGIRPVSFFRAAWPAIQLGFVSRSSIGTLPVTELAAEKLGIARSYAAFAVPLGATTKMDGCAAIYPAIAAIFVAQFYHVPLGAADYLLIAFVSVIGSAATAGVTGAVVMLTLTLSTLGLPLEGVGLLLAIDPILDMGRTAVNVAGQILVPLIVARREELLDDGAGMPATSLSQHAKAISETS
jgi:Na+/H+-dicarboxylate symporter